MPRHQQVTTCRRSGGALSKICPCEHCCLPVCSVCGGAEATLTTDCPGVRVGAERAQEVFETTLDYTDARGWHVAKERRSPRFQDHARAVESAPARVDPRALVTTTVDWARVDRYTSLLRELGPKAVAWVLADRACEDASAKLVRVEDETEVLRGQTELDAAGREVLARLEHDRIEFQLSSAKADCCDDEFHQAARVLVRALEVDHTDRVVNDLKIGTC